MFKPYHLCFSALLFAILVSGGLCLSGCTESSTAAKPEQTFKQAVTKLVEMRNTIRDGFAVGDIDKAHGPLHEVGHLLEDLTGLAANGDFTKKQMDSIHQATEKLFDAFAEVDKTLHGSEGSTYEEVASTIDTAMKTITDLAGVADESNGNSTADQVPTAGDEIETVDLIEADEPTPGNPPSTELSDDG